MHVEAREDKLSICTTIRTEITRFSVAGADDNRILIWFTYGLISP
jgi:hypothetical protein